MLKAQRTAIPVIKVNCIIFSFMNDALYTLIQKNEEEKLPGSPVLPKEDLDLSAERVLHEATGSRKMYFEQLHTTGSFSDNEDSNQLTISYLCLVDVLAQNESVEAPLAGGEWVHYREINKLNEDENYLMHTAWERLKERIRFEPIAYKMLPEKFTLSQVQGIYESITGTELDKRNFRKKLLKDGLLIPLQERLFGVAHRAPRLYKFDKAQFLENKEKGMVYDMI